MDKIEEIDISKLMVGDRVFEKKDYTIITWVVVKRSRSVIHFENEDKEEKFEKKIQKRMGKYKTFFTNKITAILHIEEMIEKIKTEIVENRVMKSRSNQFKKYKDLQMEKIRNLMLMKIKLTD